MSLKKKYYDSVEQTTAKKKFLERLAEEREAEREIEEFDPKSDDVPLRPDKDMR